MLVDAVESLPKPEQSGTDVADDAGIERALRSFAAAIDSDDSLFECETVTPRITGNALCSADFLLRFRQCELAGNRRLHLAMVQKLVELLRSAGSTETLASRICLAKQAGGTTLRTNEQAYFRLMHWTRRQPLKRFTFTMSSGVRPTRVSSGVIARFDFQPSRVHTVRAKATPLQDPVQALLGDEAQYTHR